MDSAELSRIQDKILETLARNEDAHEPTHWTPERLADFGLAPSFESLRVLADLPARGALELAPVIASLIYMTDRDSDEFANTLAVLEGKIERDMTGGTIFDAALSAGRSDPTAALRLARRLMNLGCSGFPTALLGGAASKLPGECGALIQELLASSDARRQAIAMKSVIVSAGSGYRADWDVLGALERASESADAQVRVVVTAAFVEFYTDDPPRCTRALERLAEKHCECALQLARQISAQAPFDPETSLRLLDICSGFSEINVKQKVHLALAKLANTHVEAVLEIVIKYVVRDGRVADSGRHVLEQMGKSHGEKAINAILNMPAESPCASSYVPAMARSLVASSGSKSSLKPIFEAIRSRPDLYVIGLQALHEVISDRSRGVSHVMLEAIAYFLKSLTESKEIDVKEIKDKKDLSIICGMRIRALQNRAMLDRRPTDHDLARKNLECFPTLLWAFGKAWFDQQERGNLAHPLLQALGRKLPPKEERDVLLNSANSAKTPEDLIRSIDELRHKLGHWCFLHDLDVNLYLIRQDGHNVLKYAKCLKNEQEFLDKMSEINFVVRFLGRCKLELEPAVGEKKLDAKLEICGREVYVEIFSPNVMLEFRALLGARGVRNRIPSKISCKLKQLRPLMGKGCQVILAIDVGRSEINCGFIKESLKGRPTSGRYTDEKGEIVERLTSKHEPKSLHEQDPDTDVISAFVCYSMQSGRDLSQHIESEIIHNPHARVKLDEPTTELLKKCINAKVYDLSDS